MNDHPCITLISMQKRCCKVLCKSFECFVVQSFNLIRTLVKKWMTRPISCFLGRAMYSHILFWLFFRPTYEVAVTKSAVLKNAVYTTVHGIKSSCSNLRNHNEREVVSNISTGLYNGLAARKLYRKWQMMFNTENQFQYITISFLRDGIKS